MGPNTAARYRVCVHTSDKAGAGTTAPAFMTAKGEYGTIGERGTAVEEECKQGEAVVGEK